MLKIILFFSASITIAGMDAFVVTVFVGMKTNLFFCALLKIKTLFVL